MPINTTRSWARVIDDYESVPETYKEHFAAFSVACAEPPYAVFAPPDRSFGLRQNPRIICAAHDEIRVYEKYRKEITCTVLPIRDIQYIETGTILLYSWIRISGMADGTLTTVSWTYNTSTQPIFKPIVERARGLKTAAGTDTGAFESLLSLGYKYLNMAKSAVSPSEQALQMVLQPEIREPRFTFLGRTYYRTVLPSCAIILTPRELILLTDNTCNSTKTGGTKRFIPLSRIRDASISLSGEREARCTLRLPGDETVQISLEYAQLDEINAMLQNLRSA